MAVLVTGGAGYIGSHACLELLQHGFDVVVVDHLGNGNPEALRRVAEIAGKPVRLHRADIALEDKLDRIFEAHDIEAVIHFAGLKAVGESMESPLLYYRNNVAGTLALCRTMAKHGVKKLVFSSSATVYGLPERVPIPEDAPLHAVNPYGRTKIAAEQMLQDLANSDPEWSIALLRYFNPAGAHESGRIGEDPRGAPQNLMPLLVRAAAGRQGILRIYGGDYDTPDGTPIRDYIHIMDLAAGHVSALRSVQSCPGVRVYNLGTGKGCSVLDMIRAFEKASGRPVPYRIVDRRPGDVAVSFAAVAKAERELGWSARRGIEEICADAWRWQLLNPGGYELLEASPAERRG